MTLYDKLKKAGIPVDHHESDLYCKDTPEARQIIEAHQKETGFPTSFSGFTSNIEGEGRWLDIPFFYAPFWPDYKPPRVRVSEDLRDAFKKGDSGDPWGRCMGWLFSIADYIESETALGVPEEWCFRQSPCGPDSEAWEYQELQELNVTPEEVLYFGKVLWRLRGILKAQELDY